jgi:hypothetical protein
MGGQEIPLCSRQQKEKVEDQCGPDGQDHQRVLSGRQLHGEYQDEAGGEVSRQDDRRDPNDRLRACRRVFGFAEQIGEGGSARLKFFYSHPYLLPELWCFNNVV